MLPEEWEGNPFSWGHDALKEYFGSVSTEDETEEEDYDQDCMRRDLSDIKEGIKESRAHSIIFKKIKKCEKEIFKLYDTPKNINGDESESEHDRIGGKNGKNVETSKIDEEYLHQSSSNEDSIVEVHV